MTTHAASANALLTPLCGQRGKDLELTQDARHVTCKRCSRLLDHNTQHGLQPTVAGVDLASGPDEQRVALVHEHDGQRTITELGRAGERMFHRQHKVRVTRVQHYDSTEGVSLRRTVVVFNGSEKAFNIALRHMLFLASDEVEYRRVEHPSPRAHEHASWRNQGFAAVDTRNQLDRHGVVPVVCDVSS